MLKKTLSNIPVAVIINDIHYSLKTLEAADKSMELAIDTANALDIPLFVAGDLHDTKAILRGECITRILRRFATARTKVYVTIGNHDLINERSEDNALEFLNKHVILVREPMETDVGWLVPYFSDVDKLRVFLSGIDKGSQLIMHQGIEDSDAGEYIQDKSALRHEDVQDFRVISGHYHRRQDIKIGRPRKGMLGLWSFTGNPYTLNFAEANDPDKGYHVLFEDRSLEFIPTNLRKHVILDLHVEMIDEWLGKMIANNGVKETDLIWVKVRGASDDLAKLTKAKVAKTLKLSQDFRFTLEPDAVETTPGVQNKSLKQPEILDSLIDSLSNTDDNRKKRIKDLWRSFT